MKTTMACKGYEIIRSASDLTMIKPTFVLLISQKDSEQQAEALKKIELFLAGDIDLVKADSIRPRCFYCATLNEVEATTCTQCGAPL